MVSERLVDFEAYTGAQTGTKMHLKYIVDCLL